MHHICCTVASFYQISGLTNILLLLLSSWIFSVHWFSRIMSYFRCHPLPFSDQSSPCAIIASASIIHYIWPYSFHFLLRKSLTFKGRRTKATERDILVVRCCHNTQFSLSSSTCLKSHLQIILSKWAWCTSFSSSSLGTTVPGKCRRFLANFQILTANQISLYLSLTLLAI